MKKNNLTTLMLALALCLIQNSLHSQTQLQKWYMNYYEIDFSGSTPQAAILPFAHTSKPLTSFPYWYGNLANGIHDHDGDLLFYTVWNDTDPVGSGEKLQIYNSSGNLIGDLICERDGYEMNIIPFDESLNKFIILYPIQKGAGATRFLSFVIIDLTANAGQGSMSTPYEIAASGAGAPTPSCAIGLDKSGKRFMYANINREIQKFVIDFSWYTMGFPELIVNPDPVPVVYSFPREINLTELELSHDGTKLALAESWTNKVYLIDLNSSGNFSTIQDFSLGNSIPFDDFTTGIEFNASTSKLFVNFSHLSTCMNTLDEGIYVINLTTNTVSPSPILNSGNYSRSHLELGYDGYIYAAGYIETANENRLAKIDPSSETVTTEIVLPDILPYVGDYRGYKCNPAFPGVFTLPDQIDGETTIVVNLDEVIDTEGIKIFPNPSSEYITLSMSNPEEPKIGSIEIHDNLGRLIQELKKTDISLNPKINISNLKKGIYTITIVLDNNRQFVGQVIKKFE